MNTIRKTLAAFALSLTAGLGLAQTGDDIIKQISANLGKSPWTGSTKLLICDAHLALLAEYRSYDRLLFSLCRGLTPKPVQSLNNHQVSTPRVIKHIGRDQGLLIRGDPFPSALLHAPT